MRDQVIGPVISVPAGSVSVTSVCSELPGPLLTRVITQLKGWRRLTVGTLAALLRRRSTFWRVVVCSFSLLLVASRSVSLPETVATLLNTSPVGAGCSTASKRRNRSLLSPLAIWPRADEALAGTSQLNVGSALPATEVVFVPVHSAGALQVEPPDTVVSQTKRTVLPDGGVIDSATRTPVA